jgi:hypothetical protein
MSGDPLLSVQAQGMFIILYWVALESGSLYCTGLGHWLFALGPKNTNMVVREREREANFVAELQKEMVFLFHDKKILRIKNELKFIDNKAGNVFRYIS